jgi:hypothetical protein
MVGLPACRPSFLGNSNASCNSETQPSHLEKLCAGKAAWPGKLIGTNRPLLTYIGSRCAAPEAIWPNVFRSSGFSAKTNPLTKTFTLLAWLPDTSRPKSGPTLRG